MFCWGKTSEGQLGMGGIEDTIVTVPLRNRFMEQRDIKEVASGLQHAVLLLSDGSLYSMGSNITGALGRDSGSEKRPGKSFYARLLQIMGLNYVSLFRISGCHGYSPSEAHILWAQSHHGVDGTRSTV